SAKIDIPTVHGGTAYDFDAFWIENPEVKTRYRRNEQALQAAEMLATAASLTGEYKYPVKPLYDSWILMCLNMDRNTLWGSAGGMVFVDPKSWDVNDRFDWVHKTTEEVLTTAGEAALHAGDGVGLFNPLNWTRNDPVALRLPAGKGLDGVASEALPDGLTLCRIEMPAVGAGGWKFPINRRPRHNKSICMKRSIRSIIRFASTIQAAQSQA